MTANTLQAIRRKTALVLVSILLLESVFPTTMFALTSGPGPENFTSYEPVATTNMVSDYTGDFTHNLPVLNIPGASGGGYAMSLSYHSGGSAEEESSWVGKGWTLNPGSLTRNARGNKDDVKGSKAIYYNDVPANWTVSTGVSAGSLEILSANLPISVNSSMRYNNYTGFGSTKGVGLSMGKGLISLGYTVSDGDGSFSVRVNPASLLKRDTEQAKRLENSEKYKSADANEKVKMMSEAKNSDRKNKRINSVMNVAQNTLSAYGMYAVNESVSPFALTQYNGTSVNFSANIDATTIPFPIKGEFGLNSNFSTQVNIPAQSHRVYGYLYSGEGYEKADAVMDYYMEKESSYNKRDKYLSVPFSNADLFNISGEGLGGSFRLHSATAGHFKPNGVESNTEILQGGVEITLGPDFGIGGDIGLGNHRLSVEGDWNGNLGNTTKYEFSKNINNDQYFFRFNGDMGGNVIFGANDAAVAADIYVDSDIPGAKSFHPSLADGKFGDKLTSSMDGVNRSGRSSYIGYHTNREMMQRVSGSNKYYNRYDQNPDLDQLVDRSDASIADGIGEIATFNEDGNRYVYGLPVYARKEKNMQYGLNPISGGAIQHNNLAYKDISQSKMKVGEEHPYPYATSFLLTEITTPDFVDRDMDGADENDFGGYTKFSYRQLYGTTGAKNGDDGTWNKWRIPYRGLNYNPNDLTNDEDDMGSFSSGEKEVYYLQTIETKTHLAVFVTNKTNYTLPNSSIVTQGSQNDRQDALSAEADDREAAKNPNAQGTQALEYLERIELYAKEPGTNNYKLVRTTHFKYSYSIFPGAPNTVNGAGKLTLDAVWQEAEGVVNARVSPYKFEYQYPAVTYPAPYNSGDHANIGGIQWYTSAFNGLQTPAYDEFLLDGWGNYQGANNGQARHAKMQRWVDQTPQNAYDPAAWELKRIILPSGGEIHVQYEQKEYNYVQDRRALFMVSLHSSEVVANADNLTGTYFLNVESDLGITSASEKYELMKLIQENFKDEKIYFKFLYSLLGVTPALGSCTSDYVHGYTTVKKVGIDPSGKIYIQLGGFSNYDLPKQVCLDLLKSKSGKLKPLNGCNAEADGVGQSSEVLDMVQQLVSKMLSQHTTPNQCAFLDHSLSYLRIPSTRAKRGGGNQVKRVLMYDSGIESGDAALYGSEYCYETADGKSSGVATNEPSAFREENALVTFLGKRSDQKWWSKAISGRDKEEFEGPIGESILPPPSVGHSRVVIKNIHSGKTNTGFAVNEYYTTFDYPFDKYYPNLGKGVDNTDINQRQDWFFLPTGILNLSVTNKWLSQGYRFIVSEIPGQPKRQSTYGGDPKNPATAMLSSSQEFTYYQPGEEIPLFYGLNNIQLGFPGKEVEQVFEMRSIEDVCNDGSIEIDADIGLTVIPLPFASFFPTFEYTESKLRTHISSKVIHYPVIQKSVLSFQDGIYHLSENIAFNPHNGKPLLTRTSDGYDKLKLEQSPTGHNGLYHAYTFPASSQYPEMSQKALNERAVITPSAHINIALQTDANGNYLNFTADPGYTVCDAMKWLVKGDLVSVLTTSSSSNRLYHVKEIVGSKVYLLSADHFNQGASPITGAIAKVEVIRSGRTNQLNAVAGSITTYGNSTPASIPTTGTLTGTLLQQFASNLNGLITNGTPAFLPAGLYLKGVNGTCLNCEAGVSIVLIDSDSIKTIRIQKTCGETDHIFCSKNFVNGTLFSADPVSGTILYATPDNPCHPQPWDCLQFCLPEPEALKVIASSATTFKDGWDYNSSLYASTAPSNQNSLNIFEKGMAGKWRVAANFAYREQAIGGSRSGTNERNYADAGVYSFVPFNWQDTTTNDTTHWLKLNEVKQYSPHGDALMERDIMGIYSTAKFGYQGMLPYLVGKNADYTSVQFESFEMRYSSGAKVEENVSLPDVTQWDNTVAHSGRASYKLQNTTSANDNSFTMSDFKLTPHLINKGLSIKVWVKDPGYSTAPVIAKITNSTLTKSIAFTKIAQTGQWTLYEALVVDWTGYTAGTTLTPSIVSAYTPGGSASTVWIDDLRIQPSDAQVMTYVYDYKTFKLLATFDDQHFGLYNQYNAEGKLIRKLVETERGMKTVKETQYHVPLQNRP